MIRKFLPIILCICLFAGIAVSATSTDSVTSTDTPAAAREMPAQGGGGMRGGRGGMGMPPQGENMPNGEMPPAMPEGEMPQSEMPEMPPGENTAQQGGDTAGTENSRQAPPAMNENADSLTDGTTEENVNQMPRGGMGFGMGGSFDPNMTENTQNANTQQSSGFWGFIKNYSTPVTSVILLMLAFVFVIFYKRRQY